MFQFFRWLRICFVPIILFNLGCKSDFDINQSDEKLFTIIPTDYSGLTFNNPVNQTRENNHMVNVGFISGGGVAVGDINDDGLQDIFFTGNQVKDRLFLNEGNLKFKDISTKAGISTDTKWSAGVTFIDIDHDGDQDIYVCRSVYLEDEKSANQLYINNGDLTFTEQAEKFGLADRGFSVQATFSDFDKDGLIDMYLINQPPSLPGQGGTLNLSMGANKLFSDKLYKNTGNHKFIDYSEQANVRNFAFGLSATVGDINNDSWPDIYVANDFDVPDHLYINQKNGFFKDEIFQATKHISNSSMGSDMADYDNDGYLDIMVLDMMEEGHNRNKTHMGALKPAEFWRQVAGGGHYQYMFNTLQRNNGNGTFSDLAQLARVTSTDWSWTPLMADFDNDGLKDLFISNGVKSNNRFSDLTDVYQGILDSLNLLAQKKGVRPETVIDVMDFVDLAPTDKLANYIYKNNGDYTFGNKIIEWGMELPTLSNGAAYADFDLDGDLDLIINNIDDNALLYKNNAIEKGMGNFLRFKLSTADGRSIHGTRVMLYQKDKLWQISELSNARGFISKSEDIVHFGIGDLPEVSKVVIKWPDGMKTTLADVSINQVHHINKSHVENEKIAEAPARNTLFREVAASLKLSQVIHEENVYDDYAREVLLPHKMSQFGPSLDVGDVNGDGKEDFFLGGPAGISGRLFLQNSSGTFTEVREGPWSEDKACEDMGIALVDIDNDTDLDMFIVSGGNEFEPKDPLLQDRLYINTGRGTFKKSSKALPTYLTSGSCVQPCDFDKDGDMDLFIGGRLIPGKYPHPANSHLLENQGGKFMDVSAEKASEFLQLGMVTAARWMDHNNDELIDLVVVGEWMPVTIFTQLYDGRFKKQDVEGLENSEGWYFGVATNDVDDDGDEDLVVGNLGLNYKYKASKEEPFEVYSYDFDNNGRLDIVLSYYERRESYPVRGKESSIQQIPSISEKFQTYEQFGNSTLLDIYGESLNEGLYLKAKTFASAYVENLGEGRWEIKPLPSLAQISSINNILIKDFDLDGSKDLLISGNLFTSEVETPRNDASNGLLLKGDGKGNFKPVSINESGFFAPNDAKDMKIIKVNDQEIILVANNNEHLQAIAYYPGQEN